MSQQVSDNGDDESHLPTQDQEGQTDTRFKGKLLWKSWWLGVGSHLKGRPLEVVPDVTAASEGPVGLQTWPLIGRIILSWCYMAMSYELHFLLVNFCFLELRNWHILDLCGQFLLVRLVSTKDSDTGRTQSQR